MSFMNAAKSSLAPGPPWARTKRTPGANAVGAVLG